jgi:hypothetical protein
MGIGLNKATLKLIAGGVLFILALSGIVGYFSDYELNILEMVIPAEYYGFLVIIAMAAGAYFLGFTKKIKLTKD